MPGFWLEILRYRHIFHYSCSRKVIFIFSELGKGNLCLLRPAEIIALCKFRRHFYWASEKFFRISSLSPWLGHNLFFNLIINRKNDNTAELLIYLVPKTSNLLLLDPSLKKQLPALNSKIVSFGRNRMQKLHQSTARPGYSAKESELGAQNDSKSGGCSGLAGNIAEVRIRGDNHSQTPSSDPWQGQVRASQNTAVVPVVKPQLGIPPWDKVGASPGLQLFLLHWWRSLPWTKPAEPLHFAT